ncbi:tryptophan--tRNA ligase [Candidatus Kuenenbacteria bacterium]|nr:tryptophan--tRNA ligase [Candidatus Kuenenbacteria bacterium]
MLKKLKKILVAGVQPTGKIHIGNYFGAMKQFVDLQDKYESYIFIADYHAITTVQNRAELMQGIIDVALDYLAIGLDPKKIILFKQSDISQVTELAWIFNCLTTMPYLMRAHAFKDAEVKNKEINVGLFDYPILMASDILIQDADIVSVGQDQKQHVEYARDTAQKFNKIYGKTFKIPEPFILPHVETVPGTDGRKMSKSYGNVIPLFATDEEIKKAVMKIPTDSKGVDEPKNPDESIIFAIHKLLLNDKTLKTLEDKYKKGGMGYKTAKEMLIKDLTAFIKPLREKRKMLAKDINTILEILKNGGKRASMNAEKKIKEVREKVGVKIY